jgi:hypothetical protein
MQAIEVKAQQYATKNSAKMNDEEGHNLNLLS